MTPVEEAFARYMAETFPGEPMSSIRTINKKSLFVAGWLALAAELQKRRINLTPDKRKPWNP
jgi:hypothetical protein